ncbi:hypothetical protein OFC56_31270, partial [Escherichia coli]|nr:hypothetical protein [Escherichia coli]
MPVSDQTFIAIGNSYIQPTVGWIIAAIAIIFVIFLVIRGEKSLKTYGLGEANYTSAALKAIVPILGIAAFTWVMNSHRGIPVPVMILLA